MQLTFPEIAGLVEAGRTDAEIAAELEADPRTVRNVPIDKARQILLTEWGLIYKWDGSYQGPLADLYNALPADDTRREPVRQLITHLLDNPSAVEIDLATNSAYAGAFFALLAHPALGLTPEQLATLESLHKGRRYAGVTEADVARCILRKRLDDAVLAAHSAFARGEDWVGIQAAWEGDNGGV